MKYILVLIASLLSVSCSTQGLKPGGGTAISSDSGVVVVSVTRGIKKGNFLTTKTDIDSKFFYKGNGVDDVFISHNPKLFGIGGESDLEFTDGQLNVVDLKPGKYSINSWTLFVPIGTGYKKLSPRQYDPIEFTVKKGKVTYIGNLHLETVYGRNAFGLEIEVGAEQKCFNSSERDIKRFKNKYPNLSKWTIIETPIDC